MSDVNRGLLGNELVELLKKLGVISENNQKLEMEILKIFEMFNEEFGNPSNEESMENLFLLLKNFGVDVDKVENKNIIYEVLYNKEKLGNNIIKEIGKDKLFIKKEFEEGSIRDFDSYLNILMYELGVKPNYFGFTFFKSGVLYVLMNSDKKLYGKDIYNFLSDEYGVSVSSIERAIRNLLIGAIERHTDSEVCNYVYGDLEHVKVLDSMYRVADYIRNSHHYIVLNNDIIEEIESKCQITEEFINEILLNVGISNKLLGYTYIKDAIYYILNNREDFSWVKMYKDIALKYETSKETVDRCIRFSIISGYAKRSNNMVSHYVYNSNDGVSNSKFISNVVDYIKMVDKNSLLDSNSMLEVRIDNIMHSLGMSSNVLGYNYLFDAILWVLKSDELVLFGKLYEEVGLKYGVSESKVERAIRHIIDGFVENYKDSNNIEKNNVVKFMFRYCNKFSNSEFISFLAGYIKMTDSEYLVESYKKDTGIKKVKRK